MTTFCVYYIIHHCPKLQSIHFHSTEYRAIASPNVRVNGNFIMSFNSLIRLRGRPLFMYPIHPLILLPANSYHTTSSHLLPENYELTCTKCLRTHKAERSLLGWCCRRLVGKSLPVYKRDYTRIHTINVSAVSRIRSVSVSLPRWPFALCLGRISG